VTGELGFEAFS